MSWPIVKLGELVKVKGGKRLPKGTGYSESETKYPYIRVTDFKNNSVRTSGLVYLEKEVQEQIARYTISSDDVYISIAGTIGLVGVIPDELNGANLTENAAKLVINDKAKLDKNYLIRFLSTAGQNQLHERKKITSQPKLALFRIEEVEIPLPPLEEQKRIAAILDKADSVRRKRQQAIDLADDFLRSVFLDMFGADLQRSVNITKFGDISILDAKMVDPCEEQYLDLLHIGPDRIEKNTGKLLPALTAREERLISKKFLFDEQYILYSKIRPYLRKAALPDFRALCSADMYPVKPVQGKVTREFIWMLLLSDYFDNYVSSLPARANIPKLNKTELAGFEFSLPEFSKIEKFSEIVKHCFDRSKTVATSYAESESLFNSLHQKAFVGEL